MYKSWEDEASLSDFIVSHLLSYGSLRIQKKILYELVQEKRNLNNKVFYNNLYRLKQKGVLSFDHEKNILVRKDNLRRHILFSKIKSEPAGKVRVMVLFDVPEKKRKVRNWLRMQLKTWDFKMIQQSVWLGKGPLPGEFIERLRLLGVNKTVKILKVQSVKI